MDLLASAQYGIAAALASALLHSLWQCAALAAVAAFVLRLLVRHSAATRHTVGMGFLLLMVGAPLCGFVQFWLQPAEEINSGMLPAVIAPIAARPGLFVQESNGLAALLSMAWSLGVAAMLLWNFGGWRLLGALDRHPFRPLPPHWQVRVDALQRALRISRTVLVKLSDAVQTPFTARLHRPVIWLPLTLLTRLPAEQLEALLAHELAHIARMDWLWNGVQRIAESLLFFHPAAWWLSRRIRQEREHACDDLAVAACGDAIALAEALVELERDRHSLPRLVLAARGGSLLKRISRLLSAPSGRGPRSATAGAVALLVACAVIAPQALSSQSTPTLRIESSTDGPLQPGDFREITAHGIDRQRRYRASVDAHGTLVETYEEDGKAVEIDASVRTWLAGVAHLSMPPPPPAPPEPPAPSEPPDVPEPPEPPAPPPVPEIADAADFKAILRLVAADPRVQQAVGTPVTVVSDSIDGRLSGDGHDGSAELSFTLVGPQGRALASVSATQDDAAWAIAGLAVDPQPQ